MSNSFITVNRKLVLEIARLEIKHILDCRNTLREEAIQKLMNRRYFPYKSRESAINKLENVSDLFDIPSYMYRYGGDYQKADQLIAACLIGYDEHIYLSVKDASTVERWKRILHYD